MAGFIEGADRSQLSLLPGSLDDWICSDNPVRVIDAFVDTLDLNKLGFETVEALDLGRPGYHPCVPLKLYTMAISIACNRAAASSASASVISK